MFNSIDRKSYGIAGFCTGVALITAACNVDGRHPRAQPQMTRPTAHSMPTGQRVGMGTDLAIADAGEVDLVESVVAHRQRYSESLEMLQDYYLSKGFAHKADWAALELKGLRCVKQSRYLMEAEVAPQVLKPTDSVPEADALYQQGLMLMRRGGHGVPIFYREDRMVEASNVFRELIERYPTSDKVDDAAFMLGEIHKEYLPHQEEVAVKWYERAWTWDPQTPHPARFQAAVIYDYRLHDRDRALELYQEVVRFETFHKSNVNSAGRRIHELVEEGAKSVRAGG